MNKSCACTSTTNLFSLCQACTDKAWHQAYVARKTERPEWERTSQYDMRDYSDATPSRAEK